MNAQMKITRFLGYTFLLVLMAIPQAFARRDYFSTSLASFDCSKATQPIEKMICSDNYLSYLDGRMDFYYNYLL